MEPLFFIGLPSLPQTHCHRGELARKLNPPTPSVHEQARSPQQGRTESTRYKPHAVYSWQGVSSFRNNFFSAPYAFSDLNPLVWLNSAAFQNRMALPGENPGAVRTFRDRRSHPDYEPGAGDPEGFFLSFHRLSRLPSPGSLLGLWEERVPAAMLSGVVRRPPLVALQGQSLAVPWQRRPYGSG